MYLTLLAQAALPLDVTPVDAGPLLDALSQGHWAVAAGTAIALLIAIFNRAGLARKVGKALVPWVGVAMGLLAGVGSQLVTGQPWGTALLEGLMSGALATGMWELVLKHVLKPAAPGPQV